jgi:hypothetical protein
VFRDYRRLHTIRSLDPRDKIGTRAKNYCVMFRKYVNAVVKLQLGVDELASGDLRVGEVLFPL